MNTREEKARMRMPGVVDASKRKRTEGSWRCHIASLLFAFTMISMHFSVATTQMMTSSIPEESQRNNDPPAEENNDETWNGVSNDGLLHMLQRIGTIIDREDDDGSLSRLLNDISIAFGPSVLDRLTTPIEEDNFSESEDRSRVNEPINDVNHKSSNPQNVNTEMLLGKQEDIVEAEDLYVEEEYELNDEEEYYDDGDSYYADWHVQHMFDLLEDPDCMEGDVDATSSDFTIERAAQIWHKCRLLIVRNLFDRPTIETYRQNVTQFMYDLNSGNVNPNGKTSYGEEEYIYDVDVNRWDLLLPSRLLPKDIVTNPILMNILKNELVLGENLALVSNGIHMSEKGSRAQEWHNDGPYAYGTAGTLRYHGAAGLEYPSTEITMFVPLLNITGQHGPTQFCMGSSALQGIELPEGSEKLHWYNQKLKDEFFSETFAIHEGSEFVEGWCPRRMWRSAEIQLGDLVLWDYDLNHRAGYNNSTDFRSAVYATFARTRHIKDTNFNNDEFEDMEDFSEQSLHMGRFAIIPNYSPPVFCHLDDDSDECNNDDYDDYDDDDDDVDDGEHNTASTSQLTFANITSKFLPTPCRSCHDQSPPASCVSHETYK